MSPTNEFTATSEGYTITAVVEVIEKDLLIKITGGDYPHIGTVTTLSKAMAIETMRFPSHDGRFHKDDLIAVIIAKKIQPLLPGNCVITAGVHVDGITPAQIKAASKMALTLAEEISLWLTSQKFDNRLPVYH